MVPNAILISPATTQGAHTRRTNTHTHTRASYKVLLHFARARGQRMRAVILCWRHNLRYLTRASSVPPPLYTFFPLSISSSVYECVCISPIYVRVLSSTLIQSRYTNLGETQFVYSTLCVLSDSRLCDLDDTLSTRVKSAIATMSHLSAAVCIPVKHCILYVCICVYCTPVENCNTAYTGNAPIDLFPRMLFSIKNNLFK